MKLLNEKLLKEKIETRVFNDMADGRVDNVAIAVYQNGAPVYTGYFGSTRSVNGHSLYRLASMTKPITTVAALILVERGTLWLDDLVEQYLPEYANRMVAQGAELVPSETPLRIRHLLTHTSGLSDSPAADKIMAEMTDEHRRTLQNSVAFYARLPLAFQPGRSQAYSGVIAWDVLVAILQKVTGEDFAAFVSREIFAPCGMVDTTFVPSAEQWARVVPMHSRVDGKSTESQTKAGCVFESFPCTHYLGGAGLVSSLSDYVKFAEMLQNGGVCDGHRILSADLVRMMGTPQLSENVHPGDQSWGFGVRVIRNHTYPYLPVGCFGWSGAYGSHFWVDPENRITAVYMKNSRYDGGSGALTGKQFEEDVYTSF